MYDHPSMFEEVEFDEGNESELAAHHISAAEAWEVVYNGPSWARNKNGRAGFWLAVGRTDGGRYLTLAVAYDPDTRTLRPITGWKTTDGERTRYH